MWHKSTHSSAKRRSPWDIAMVVLLMVCFQWVTVIRPDSRFHADTHGHFEDSLGQNAKGSKGRGDGTAGSGNEHG